VGEKGGKQRELGGGVPGRTKIIKKNLRSKMGEEGRGNLGKLEIGWFGWEKRA